jgi:uncharacterized protein DUF4386
MALAVENRSARLAGLSYLVMIMTVGAWYGIGQSFLDHGAAQAASSIQAGRTLFDAMIVVGAIGFVDFLVLGVLLYQLFNPVAVRAARLMLAFVAVSVPIFFAVVARQMDVVSIVDAMGRLPNISVEQAQLQIEGALQSYRNLFLVTTIFSGLWLVPLGWAVVRSNAMPKTIGILLLGGSVFYVLTFVGTVFNPEYGTTLVARVIGFSSGIAAVLGELGACGWLLIKGELRRAASTGPVAAV